MERKSYFENEKQYSEIVLRFEEICKATSDFICEFQRLKFGNPSKKELYTVINNCKPVPPLGREARIINIFSEKYKNVATKELYLGDVMPNLHKSIIDSSIKKDLEQLGMLGTQLQILFEEMDPKIFNFERLKIDYDKKTVEISESELTKIKEEFCSIFIESERQDRFANLLEKATEVLNEINQLSGKGESIFPDCIYLEKGNFYINPYSVKLVK